MSTIKKNLQDLPAAAPSDGTPPNRDPKFVTELAEAWYAELLAGGVDLDLAIPEAGPYRASYAGLRCDRALMYALRGDEKSNPPSIADQWRFWLGHVVHREIQDVARRLWGDRTEIEEAIDLTPAGIPGSAHVDLIYPNDDHEPVIVIELKSINGFGFKMSATSFKGAPEGPRSGHALQAAMVAVARNIPYFAVGYFSLENLSPSMAGDFANGEIGRFTAEWRFKTDDWVPEVNREAQRIARILGDIDAGRMTARTITDPEYPEGALIEEPDRKGRWQATTEDGVVVGTGTTWFCDYCDQRDRCLADGATPVTIG